MESDCLDKTLRMREMNRNMCILRMLEDTFSHGAANIIVKRCIIWSDGLEVCPLHVQSVLCFFVFFLFFFFLFHKRTKICLYMYNFDPP